MMRTQIENLFVVGLVGLMVGCTVEVVDSNTGASGSGGSGTSAGSGGAAGLAGKAGAGPGGSSGADSGTGDGAASDGPGRDTATDPTTLDTSPGDGVSTRDVVPEGALPDTPVPTDRTGSPDTPGSDVSSDAMSDRGDSADGAACLGEDQADSGVPVACDTLPYYFATCSDDAGDVLPPVGAGLCETLRPSLKRSAFQGLFDCLMALDPATSGISACSAAHERAAAECSQTLFSNRSCPVPDSTVDGGTYGCSEIAASCRPDAGPSGASISVAECWAWLGPFNRTTRQEIIDCYLDPQVTGATSCRDKFENFCAFPE